MECGPAAIFNAFLIGNRELRASIARLPGATFGEKYAYAIRKLANKPSEAFGGARSRLIADWGMADDDMPAFARDILDKNEYFQVDRPKQLPGESTGAFAARINDEIHTSLAYGIPPVVVISAIEDGKAVNVGHAVTAVGIDIPSMDNGFTLYFVDPLQDETKIPFKVIDSKIASARKIQRASSTGESGPIEQTWYLSFVMGRLSP